MAMTLEQAVSRAAVYDRVAAFDPVVVKEHGVFLDAEAWGVIRAHLTQPAQAVDDALVEEAIEAFDGKLLETYPDSSFHKLGEGDKAVVRASMRAAITRALAGEQAGWRDMDSAPKDGTRVMLTNGHGVWMGEYLAFYTSGARADEWVSAMLNHDHIERSHRHDKPTGWRPLPASPTPDKETQR